VSGAATGVGGLVTMIPDLVSLAWLQSRMAFFVARAFGWAPFDPMRPAELLALTRLHHDPASARPAPRARRRRQAQRCSPRTCSARRETRLKTPRRRRRSRSQADARQRAR
jgi:hypothetical protein